ncbi:hypothetical protein CEP54_013662 [Fusarium duplospermum]|uniref:Uncharacterized protein n=1 Tax=Fusarium duplospermum TaxID=1325734 RepID=A0A428P1I4_9HYPO|nr:hypothetical protein CEP54_013662 [Fusarium duplospermum]
MPFAEYKIEFSSMVRINLLRQKIQYAQSILTNTLETVATIQVHEETVSNHLRLSSSTRTSFRTELNNISNDLRNFLTTAQKLLALSTDSRSIHEDILSFHKQDLSHRNSIRLTQIAEADSAESRIMASIAERTHQDSRQVRVMTMIALFYLPINLVLSFFSTTL